MIEKVGNLERLEKLLENIWEDACLSLSKVLPENGRKRVDELFIWLFRYKEAIDTLEHWAIYPSEKEKEGGQFLNRVRIRGGAGTVGYVLRSKKVIGVNNTFDDPRAHVTIEDTLIKNCSWLGIPVLENESVRLIVSFCFPFFNAWSNDKELNEDKEAKVISSLKKVIEKYRSYLLLHHKLDILRRREKILVEPTTVKGIERETEEGRAFNESKECEAMLQKLRRFSYWVSTMPYIIFLRRYKDEYRIPSESPQSYVRLDIKNIIDKLRKELVWRYYFKEFNQREKEGRFDNKLSGVLTRLFGFFKSPSLEKNRRCNALREILEFSIEDEVIEILKLGEWKFFIRVSFVKEGEETPKEEKEEIEDFIKYLHSKEFETAIEYIKAYLQVIKKKKDQVIQKRYVEAVDYLFILFARRLIFEDTRFSRKYEGGVDKFLENLEKVLEGEDREEIRKKREKFAEMFGNNGKLKKYGEKLRDRLIALSFWQRHSGWVISNRFEDIFKDISEISFLKELATIKVFYRAIEDGWNEWEYSPLINAVGAFKAELDKEEKRIRIKKDGVPLLSLHWERGVKFTPRMLEINPPLLVRKCCDKLKNKGIDSSLVKEAGYKGENWKTGLTDALNEFKFLDEARHYFLYPFTIAKDRLLLLFGLNEELKEEREILPALTEDLVDNWCKRKEIEEVTQLKVWGYIALAISHGLRKRTNAIQVRTEEVGDGFLMATAKAVYGDAEMYYRLACEAEKEEMPKNVRNELIFNLLVYNALYNAFFIFAKASFYEKMREDCRRIGVGDIDKYWNRLLDDSIRGKCDLKIGHFNLRLLNIENFKKLLEDLSIPVKDELPPELKWKHFRYQDDALALNKTLEEIFLNCIEKTPKSKGEWEVVLSGKEGDKIEIKVTNTARLGKGDKVVGEDGLQEPQFRRGSRGQGLASANTLLKKWDIGLIKCGFIDESHYCVKIFVEKGVLVE